MSLPMFFFASGWSFFFGVAMILLAVVIGARESRKTSRPQRDVSIDQPDAPIVSADETNRHAAEQSATSATIHPIVGQASSPSSASWFRWSTWLFLIGVIAGVIPSATPAPIWLIIIGVPISLAWFFGNRRSSIAWLTSTCWLAWLLIELPYHLPISLKTNVQDVVGVIGDSISAPMHETKGDAWPTVLAEHAPFKVMNSARAGANCVNALSQADELGDQATIVMVEIGGNDLFQDMWNPGGVTRFEQNYDALLTKLARPHRTLVGVELPLPPLCQQWSSAQRRIAAKHRVRLIPKWQLAWILATSHATTDSIHPSAYGAELLARLMGDVLQVKLPPILVVPM